MKICGIDKPFSSIFSITVFLKIDCYSDTNTAFLNGVCVHAATVSVHIMVSCFVSICSHWWRRPSDRGVVLRCDYG